MQILMSESNVDLLLLWYRLHPEIIAGNVFVCVCVCVFALSMRLLKSHHKKIFIFLLSHFFYAHMCKISVGEVQSGLG